MLQELNEVTGEFSIVAVKGYTWQDQSLIWDPTDHNGVYNIVLPVSNVWYPKLTLVNPSHKVDKPVENWTDVRVTISGDMGMISVSLFRATCSIDATYYPFDTQVSTCNCFIRRIDNKVRNNSLYAYVFTFSSPQACVSFVIIDRKVLTLHEIILCLEVLESSLTHVFLSAQFILIISLNSSNLLSCIKFKPYLVSFVIFFRTAASSFLRYHTRKRNWP